MSTADTYRWADSVLGEHIQFPGHPLVLACMIMDRYPDLASATEVSAGADFSNAQRDSFLPGTGCAITSALATLRLAAERDAGAASAHADRYWDGWEKQSSSNQERAERGRQQAARIHPVFLAKVQAWGTAADQSSSYRTT
ncbi:MAG TPA: hypothetical protein DIW86_10975 [Pseudomonas sp.]|jgi:hypothetical protein|nr:hypothetical protein [Pseudomonas sp.]